MLSITYYWKRLEWRIQVHTSYLTYGLSVIEKNDLGPIAAMFWQNEEYTAGLSQHIYLDGVVCVVDAVFGEKVGQFLVQSTWNTYACAANG